MVVCGFYGVDMGGFRKRRGLWMWSQCDVSNVNNASDSSRNISIIFEGCIEEVICIKIDEIVSSSPKIAFENLTESDPTRKSSTVDIMSRPPTKSPPRPIVPSWLPKRPPIRRNESLPPKLPKPKEIKPPINAARLRRPQKDRRKHPKS